MAGSLSTDLTSKFHIVALSLPLQEVAEDVEHGAKKAGHAVSGAGKAVAGAVKGAAENVSNWGTGAPWQV
jgi:hypothetical protein